MSAVGLVLKNPGLDDDLFNEMCEDALETLRAATPVDTGNAQAGWQLNKTGSTATIGNPVEYSSFLEHGHSSQAPSGMFSALGSEFDKLIVRRDRGSS